MASKGRWSLRAPDWAHIYWHHSLDREMRLSGLAQTESPTAEHVKRASARARLVHARYKRMLKRRAKRG